MWHCLSRNVVYRGVRQNKIGNLQFLYRSYDQALVQVCAGGMRRKRPLAGRWLEIHIYPLFWAFLCCFCVSYSFSSVVVVVFYFPLVANFAIICNVCAKESERVLPWSPTRSLCSRSRCGWQGWTMTMHMSCSATTWWLNTSLVRCPFFSPFLLGCNWVKALWFHVNTVSRPSDKEGCSVVCQSIYDFKLVNTFYATRFLSSFLFLSHLLLFCFLFSFHF